jgi:photosynthetic reaction center cytochrome c subunit
MNARRSPHKVSRTLIWLLLGLAALIWIPANLIARAGPSQQNAAKPGQEGTEQPSSLPQAAPPGVKAASEAYLNVQVLSDIPADQLIASMRYITFALGVRCDYCHSSDHFESDEKPTKKRARGMMKMMFAIDNQYFGGHRAVTCYTCHRGAAQAASMPTLSDVVPAAGQSDGNTAEPPAASAPSSAPSANVMSATANPLPSAEEIIEQYTRALGGESAINKIKTHVDKGTLEVPARRMHSMVEIVGEAPNKIVTIVHGPRGDSSQGYNGQIGWQERGGEVEELSGDDLMRAKEAAAFNPGMNLKQNYQSLEVKGIEKLTGHDAYVVSAARTTGSPDRYYFDARAGLLLRIATQIESALGAIPQNTDYEDYREVSGVKVPFLIRVIRPDSETIYKWEQIQANVPVEESRFDKPAEKPKEEPAQKH